MSFVEFYHQFINEGFVNHSTVKYRAMGATNKVFRGMLNGIKQLNDNYIDEINRLVVDNIIKPAIRSTITFTDLEPYEDKLTNEVLPEIERIFQIIRQKKPTLETLWFWYVLFSAGVSLLKLKKDQSFVLVDSQEEGFLFLPQDLEKKYNNGEVSKLECMEKGLTYYGGKFLIKKQGTIKGSWLPTENKICVYLPCLAFQSNAKNTYLLYRKSSVEGSIHKALNIYERLTNREFFNTFVKELQTSLKATISHEVTHAW